MRLTDRDFIVLKEVGLWRVVLGRHIKELADFPTLRVCDRRLKILMDNNYLTREKIFCETPRNYSLTHKSRILLGLNKRANSPRLDQFQHDIRVLDTVLYFLKAGLKPDNFISDKELRRGDGFVTRQHKPDFVICDNGKKTAVEVELSIKTLQRLEENIRNNFLTYDSQFWIIEKSNNKINSNLQDLTPKYPNTQIIFIEDILK
jgi:hypothetical protein